MKKYLALLLAIVLAFGAVACGTAAPATTEAPASETPAAATEAPAATETPAAAETAAATSSDPLAALNLRAGEIVEVGSSDEFYAAYADICNPNGKYNVIRLAGNIQPNGKMEKYNDIGVDTSYVPYLSSNQYICVRMPEGTALDLNGFTITVRTIQGMDDGLNGENKGASGLTTLGNIVDTFMGGAVVVNSWLDDQHLQIGLQLARDYPEFVTKITLTQEIKDAAGHSYEIPENVQLNLSAKNSKLSADKLTLKPGATLTISEAAAENDPLGECKEIIFECRTEADKTRKGTELPNVKLVDVA